MKSRNLVMSKPLHEDQKLQLRAKPSRKTALVFMSTKKLPGSARGILAWMLRRRWGMTALRENARLKLERLEFVGRGAQAAADRRSLASAASAARSRAAAAFALSRGSRTRRGGA